mgnify:CR=1 FL=1
MQTRPMDDRHRDLSSPTEAAMSPGEQKAIDNCDVEHRSRE